MQSVYIFIGIIAFFVIALTISNYIQRKKGNTQEREATPPAINLGQSGCCGMHAVCERDNLIAPCEEKPEYFDDDELDRYKDRNSTGYTAAEINEFRDVFYSVLDEEKTQWIKSLRRRGIAIPDQMRDEIIRVVNELREQEVHS